MPLFKKQKALIGLDIGSSAIKAVELSKSKKGYEITALACEPVATDAIVDGAIMDSAAVSNAIRRALTSGGFKAKGVAASVSGHSVIVKRVTLPAATPAEVAASIEFDAEQYIPFQLSEVNLDYEVVGPAESDDLGMDVLLVVAKKDKIRNHTGAIGLAGRSPDVVDIDAFALQNAFEANYAVDPQHTVALLNIGASLMNINITRGGVPFVVRDVSVGGNQYTDILQKDLSLSFQEAEDLKLGRKGADQGMVQPLMESVTDMLVLEIQKTFDFFRETYPQESISQVWVSGGASQVPGLVEKIQQVFGYPTQAMNPFQSVGVGSKVDAREVAEMGPSLAVAVGLALRGFDQ
ncbi:MAG TPA: type IV pilus assembly protein PilM [Terriglobia bacterium]|nr:type IV pilus assembly protein PilM [Terriglobia bacterium]